ncbi:MAG: alpha/beta fold hydrolase [Mycolicibacterium fortuitum]|uniref:alpha/beta hydrolase n=1 Tax=Mycolicibacterium fortuitum TaxID=1766 RepID=UPI0022BA3805|nr:alpha/beta fold hydrolase [Mycolicibacterium fortuitum]WAY19765.1 lysophospholipase [Mycolicibacterium fortuitum]
MKATDEIGQAGNDRVVGTTGTCREYALEVIDKGAVTAERPVPLLFVHGMMHATWCWDEHFLDFFANKGYRVVALSLRGHGESTPKPLRGCSIADFVDDVDLVASKLPIRPVVIGHSMGGMVVQKYLEEHAAPAAVLVASVPPSGAGTTFLRLTKRHPVRAMRTLLTTRASCVLAGTPAVARENFFSELTPDADVVRHTARLDEEYLARLLLPLLLLKLPKPQRITVPMLVLGGERDALFTPRQVRATAAAYRGKLEIFPEMGHDMMLEPGWMAVAESIHGWLGTLVPAAALRPSP